MGKFFGAIAKYLLQHPEVLQAVVDALRKSEAKGAAQ
jgi:hypothetical protein